MRLAISCSDISETAEMASARILCSEFPFEHSSRSWACCSPPRSSWFAFDLAREADPAAHDARARRHNAAVAEAVATKKAKAEKRTADGKPEEDDDGLSAVNRARCTPSRRYWRSTTRACAATRRSRIAHPCARRRAHVDALRCAALAALPYTNSDALALRAIADLAFPALTVQRGLSAKVYLRADATALL